MGREERSRLIRAGVFFPVKQRNEVYLWGCRSRKRSPSSNSRQAETTAQGATANACFFPKQAISIIPATLLSYARSACRAIRWLSFDWTRISSAQCSKPMNQSQTWRKARFSNCERGFRFSPRLHLASMLDVDGWWDTPKKASASISLPPRSLKRPSITARGKHRCH